MRQTARIRSGVLAVGLFLACSAGSAMGAMVEGLYRAELLVAEQTQQLPVARLTQGLREVLVKVTGRTDVSGAQALRPLLDDPAPYLQQFSYHATTEPMQTADGREVLAQRLIMEFDPRLLDQQLVAAGYRPLGGERPALLTWVVEEQGGYRDYIGREEDPALAQMYQRAQERGLPLFRPLMDLTDTQLLPVEDAWGFFQEAIRRASARYSADAILTGQVYQAPDGWRSRWLLLWNGHSASFNGTGSTLGQHLQSAVDFGADQLFDGYLAGAPSNEREGLLVNVENVRSFESFATLIDFINGLSSVRRASVEQVDGSSLTLRVVLAGSDDQFKESLRLNNRLQPLFRVRAEGAQAQLDYDWR